MNGLYTMFLTLCLSLNLYRRWTHFSGMASCDGLTLEVVIPGPPAGYTCNPEAPTETLRIAGLECSGQESCRNAEINVINNGCDKVLIDDLKCFGSDACTGTKFNFQGDIELANCDLGPSGLCSNALSQFVSLWTIQKVENDFVCRFTLRSMYNMDCSRFLE